MANSDNRYEMLPLRELSKLSWVVRDKCPLKCSKCALLLPPPCRLFCVVVPLFVPLAPCVLGGATGGTWP